MLEGGNNFLLSENSNVLWGSGNLDVDPRFVNQENLNFELLASSQLINAGHPDSLDSDGSRADIGVYPYLNSYAGPVWYISQNGNDTTATGSRDNPFLSIQSGINFSNPNDSVYVESGTYIENINIRKNINLIGEDRETTIIDGTGGRNIVTVENTSAFYINGFTIQNADLQEQEGLNMQEVECFFRAIQVQLLTIWFFNIIRQILEELWLFMKPPHYSKKFCFYK